MMFYRNRKGLLSCSYDRSGGMENSSYHVSLETADDGKKKLIITKETGSDDSVTEVFDADSESLEKIENIVNGYKIPKWQKCRRSRIQVLDREYESFRFVYADGKTVMITSEQRLPLKSSEAIDKIMKTMYASKREMDGTVT